MSYYQKKPAIRYGWLRALIFLIVWGFLAVVVSYLGSKMFDVIGLSLNEQDITYSILGYGVTLLLTLVLLFLFMRFVDRQPFLDLGLRLTERKTDLFLGFFWAGFLLTIGALYLGRTGHIEFFPGEVEMRYLFLSLVFFLMVSFFEEIVFRGYILKNLMQSMNKYVALLISSLLFAVVHLSNPSIDIIGFLNLFIAGIFLGVAYTFTKNIWFAIGLHWGWNFVQGPILGFEVSGHETGSLWAQEMLKDNLISGGDFGFEGSILATILLVAACIVFFLFFNRKYGNKGV